MGRMNALRIVKPGQTEFVEVDVPEPGPTDVTLRLGVVGLCGTDLNTFRGVNPLVQYPLIPGHEIGAVIASVGSEVPERWKPDMEVLVLPYTNCGCCTACRQGRRNCCRGNKTLGVQRHGAMSEYVTLPCDTLYTSATLSMREMALVEPLTIGHHAVSRGQVKPGNKVAVFGCGPIGLGAIASSSYRGAEVIAVDVNDGKLELAAACGASKGINSVAEDLHDALQSLTDGDGPDVIIEAVGNPRTYRAAVEEVCFAGRVVYIGYAKVPVDYESSLFVLKELDILGSRNALPGDFDDVIGMLESAAVPVDCIISRTVPFEEVGEALRQWDEDPASVTKIQVKFPAAG